MVDGQDEDGQDDHCAFEDHEGDFLVGEGAVEALLEFGDSETGADEDEERGGGEGWRS